MERVLKARRWGGSLGVVIPRDIAEQEGIAEGEEIFVQIIPKRNPLAKSWGMFADWGESSQKIKDNMRAELYDD